MRPLHQPEAAWIAVVFAVMGVLLTVPSGSKAQPPTGVRAPRPEDRMGLFADPIPAKPLQMIRRPRVAAPQPAQRELPAVLTPAEMQKPEVQPPGVAQNPLRPVRFPQGGIAVDFAVAVGAPGETDAEAPVAELTPALNTSEELERLLDRADQIVTAGRPDLAPVLWQRVLDEGAGVLATQAGGVQQTSRHTYQRYRPLQEEAERRIVAAGKEALRAYRLNSDGHAQAFLAGSAPAERERALAEVVRRYFLTAIGDDAAFELGCLQLERREYASAAQWLAKLQQYPDSAIPREQFVARLSVALSRIGSVAAATNMLSSDVDLSPEVKELLLASFQSLGQPVIAERAPAGWPMFFGDPSRTGLMPDVAGIDWARPLGDAWEYQPNFTLKSAAPQQQGRRTATTIMNGRMVQILIDDNGRVTRSPQEVAGLPDLSRADLAARWRDGGWQPVGELLFADGRLLLKAEDRIVCCAADTGAVQWMGRKTRYPLDAEMQQSAAFAAAGMVVTDDGGDKRPRTFTETVLFGDRVAQSMAVVGDIVLNVEGELDYLKKPPPKQQDANQALQLMMMRGQAVGGADMSGQNWLAAYELRTGKLRWHRGAGDGETASGRFLCAPLPVGDSLIAAVGDETRIIAAALDRETGATLWRVTLCDTPGEGRVSQAPVGLAAGEGDLYVATGSGTVFALDALSGSVKWAAAYPRRLPKYVGQGQVLMRAMQGGDGSAAPTYSRAEFRDNLILRKGDQVIVLASDFDHAFALDVQSGTLRWEAPLAPTGSGAAAQYCLGVLEGRMYLGGPRVLRAYDLRGGRLEWERPLEGSSGRGLLTRGGLYVPEKDRIMSLDPRTGVVLNSTSVVAPEGAPVGNLYSDGGRLFAVGAARVSALGPAEKAEQEATP